MPAFITIGRVLFAVLFIVSGAMKLLDIAATTQMMQSVVIPAVVTPYTSELEGLAGMPMAQILAITVGIVELVCGLLIALNFGAGFFAIVLAIFVVVATFHSHDFWNQTGPEARNNMIHALKNLSLIGALLIIAGLPRMSRTIETTYNDA